MILPKPILAELGVESGAAMELIVENGRVIATPIKKKRKVREGWADAAALIADEPLTIEELDWIGFGNDDDDKLEW